MSARRILSCILLPAYLSSCTSWQVQRVSPAQVVEEEQPSQVRVTTTGLSDVLLEEPRVSGDSLIGVPLKFSWTSSSYIALDTASALSIPLADISQIKVRKSDAGKTVMLLAGLVVGAVIVKGIVSYLQSCQSGKAAPLGPRPRGVPRC